MRTVWYNANDKRIRPETHLWNMLLTNSSLQIHNSFCSLSRKLDITNKDKCFNRQHRADVDAEDKTGLISEIFQACKESKAAEYKRSLWHLKWHVARLTGLDGSRNHLRAKITFEAVQFSCLVGLIVLRSLKRGKRPHSCIWKETTCL